jgi:hypothetical protein
LSLYDYLHCSYPTRNRSTAPALLHAGGRRDEPNGRIRAGLLVDAEGPRRRSRRGDRALAVIQIAEDDDLRGTGGNAGGCQIGVYAMDAETAFLDDAGHSGGDVRRAMAILQTRGKDRGDDIHLNRIIGTCRHAVAAAGAQILDDIDNAIGALDDRRGQAWRLGAMETVARLVIFLTSGKMPADVSIVVPPIVRIVCHQSPWPTLFSALQATAQAQQPIQRSRLRTIPRRVMRAPRPI